MLQYGMVGCHTSTTWHTALILLLSGYLGDGKDRVAGLTPTYFEVPYLTEKSVKGDVFQTRSLPQCSKGIDSGFQPHRLLTHVVMWANFQVQPRRCAITIAIPYVTPNYMQEW